MVTGFLSEVKADKKAVTMYVIAFLVISLCPVCEKFKKALS